MPITLDKYYNRFSPSNHYDQHLFRAGNVLQSAELNEIQSSAQHRLRMVTDTLFGEGDVMSGGAIVVEMATGQCDIAGGAVYLGGAVRGVPERSFVIPTTGLVNVGVYLVENEVTELDDPALLDPAVSMRNFQEPGAGRLKIEPTWGHEGDGQAGDFYPVYRVEDGLVLDKNPPPDIDAISAAVARYDQQSAGGMYVSSGFTVKRLADVGGNQIYSMDSGVARVMGREVVRQHARRVVHAATPSTRTVTLEPHTASGGTERVDLNRGPVANITSVSITKQVVETVTHGLSAGSSDLLDHRPVTLVVSVVQGGTTYIEGTDYQLTADQIDWSLAGAEPAPGSTYAVTYQYVTSVTPTLVDDGGFTVTDAVAGTLIQTTYAWAMPRYDLLCIDHLGDPQIITGVSAVQDPRVPSPPSHLLKLAVIQQVWTDETRIINNAVRVVAMSELNRQNTRIDTLFALAAEERLALNLTQRDPTAKKGVFTDPFLDDDLRDAGISQTGAIFRGELTLGIDASANSQTLSEVQTLDVTTSIGDDRIIIRQPLRTGAMRVNPYDAFSPLPAVVKISPSVDFWTETQTNWLSPITRQFDQDVWTNPEHQAHWWQVGLDRGVDMEWWWDIHARVVDESVVQETEVNRVGSRNVDFQFLREIEIEFEIEGMGPGETLNTVTFDGISVAFSEVV